MSKPTLRTLATERSHRRERKLWHNSENPDSGLIAYQAHEGGMEFVVADRGIGLLASLQQNSQFSHLRDHGAALRAALTDGYSRFGADIGRGLGFRAVFLGLANAVGELRFRTGDHVLMTAGESPSLITATLAQRAHLRGVLVQIRWKSNRVAMRGT